MATYYVHAKAKEKDLFVLFLVSLRTSLVAHMVKDQPANTGRRPGFAPWVRKIPWRRQWQPTPVFMPGESHGQDEPGGVQSMGLQRVGRDCSTNT